MSNLNQVLSAFTSANHTLAILFGYVETSDAQPHRNCHPQGDAIVATTLTLLNNSIASLSEAYTCADTYVAQRSDASLIANAADTAMAQHKLLISLKSMLDGTKSDPQHFHSVMKLGIITYQSRFGTVTANIQ